MMMFIADTPKNGLQIQYPATPELAKPTIISKQNLNTSTHSVSKVSNRYTEQEDSFSLDEPADLSENFNRKKRNMSQPAINV